MDGPSLLTGLFIGWLLGGVSVILLIQMRLDESLKLHETKTPRTNWDKRWLIGWGAVLCIALGYELIGYGAEIFGGTYALPPLSNILVGTIPLRLLDALTIIIAAVLVWHWHQVKKDDEARKQSMMQGIAAQYGDPFQDASPLGKLWILLKAIPVLVQWILAEWWYAMWSN